MKVGKVSSPIKLTIELVPRTAWFSNVRSMVSREDWDVLRKECYVQASNRCEICGGSGGKHPVEAHEVWEYDDQLQVQKLIRLIALCPSCHAVKHIGNAFLRGVADDALDHFQSVNALTQKKTLKLLKEAFSIWEERSSRQWICDVSWLDNKGVPYQPERQGTAKGAE
ncbi:MAG: HNH endonuclease [Gallionella sp.]|nr:HNH endonuclease [Gallionella sp.]